MSYVNQAAWLPAKRVKPLQIGPAPYTPPGAGQIVVKNGATAINPVDWAKQLLGDLLLGYIRYPFVLGGDVAGQVIEVGPGVHRFRAGDRVLGLGIAGAPASNNPAEGGFQHYTVLREHLVAPIPDWVTYEEACVVPLTLATAAYGLFHKDFLALNLPTVPPRPAGNGKAVIITGGASIVGSNAVQLAVSAGYRVYSTASPKNFAYVEKLGAASVFDYHSKTMVQDMVSELREQKAELVGALAIGDGAVDACIDILNKCGATNKFVAVAGGSIPAGQLKTTLGMATFALSMFWDTGKSAAKSRLAGVRTKFIDTKDLAEADCVVGNIFQDFLPNALVARQFVPAPAPLVVGTGLETIQEAMDVQAKGVSAQKVVVSLGT